MRFSIKALLIIAVIIGIIWSFFGFFGIAIFQGIEEGLSGELEKEKAARYENVAVKSALALIFIIMGLVFGLIAIGKGAGKGTTITMGILLGGSGVIAIILYSYIAGSIYVLCSLLSLIMGLTTSREER